MKIVVGLGNIGEKYLKTRHNAGFLVLDELLKQLKEAGTDINLIEQTKFKAFTAKIKYQNQEVLLVKPSTFMNNSGLSVNQILQFYKEPLENLIVIYDDIDLPLGTIRTRNQGSAGTHNGMRSIIETLGSKNFPRIRIGIESRGTITVAEQPLDSYVLSIFTKTEEPLIAKSIKEAVEKLQELLK